MKIGLLVAAATLLTLSGLAARQAATSRSNPEAAALYKWFDSLDYDLVRTGRFVKLRHKGWRDPEYGFVPAGPGKPAKALGIDLNDLNNGSDFDTCEPTDLGTFAGQALKLMEESGDSSGETVNVTAAFVLSRACEANGLHRIGKQLFRWADTHPDKIQQPYSMGLMQGGSIQDSIAGSTIMPVDAGFYDKHIDYSRQLEGYRRIARLFGDLQVGAIAKGWVATLSALPPTPPDRDRNVDWLIKALPAEDAQQTMSPGFCEVFDFNNGEGGGSPAHKLAELGLKAVPNLIAAISDERPTHSGAASYSLPVGEVALQTLEHIAGRSFGSGFPPRAKDDRLAACEAVLAWWKNVQRVGEFDELCKEAADPDNSTAAIALAQRYPTKSSAVVSRILLREPLGNNHLYLIEALGQHMDAAAVSVLKEAAVSDRSKLSRVQAAMELGSVNRALSEQLLVREERQPPPKQRSNGLPANGDDSFAQQLQTMALARLNNLQSLESITEGFSSKPADYRRQVLFDMEGEVASGEAAYNRKLQAFLVGELDDEDESSGDWAAELLHGVFPSEYPSASSPFRYERRRLRAGLKNVWRVSQGQKPLPLPTLAPPLPKSKADAYAESIQVLGNTPGSSDITSLAIDARSKPMSWPRLQALFVTAAKLPLKGHKGARILLSREAPNHGLTLLIDLGFESTPGSYPGIAYASSLTLSNADIGGGEGGIDLSNPGDFGVTEANLKRCLTAGADRPFVIDCKIWPSATR